MELVPSTRRQLQIYVNMCHKDAKMREMFRNKDFRVALSLGIDRGEIIDLVYLQQSEPWQTGPRKTHPWYYEKLSKQNTDYDPDEANAMLDKLGYDKKDGQGFRLRPDGQKIFFSIDVIHDQHRSGGFARAGEKALGEDRHRFQDQHGRAVAVLFARRQQRL